MKDIYAFLSDLRKNNNRDWFNANKSRYLTAKTLMDDIAAKLIDRLSELEMELSFLTPKDCVYRIYRDARFSANKDPYKQHLGCLIVRGGKKSPYAGYYVHIEPGNTLIGGGIYMPAAPVLKQIRTKIIAEHERYRAIIEEKAFHDLFPEIYGERLKKGPKGFDKDHPQIELIKNKSYFVVYEMEDAKDEDAFIDTLMEVFTIQRPYQDFLNEAVNQLENE
jgi:uncharacterized protein (TIGR02453 family)